MSKSPYMCLFFTHNKYCRLLTATFALILGLHKYSDAVYDACGRSFDALPIAALIDGKFFAVHGGISPHLDRISELNQVRALSQSKSKLADGPVS
jgi:hypothetical protein